MSKSKIGSVTMIKGEKTLKIPETVQKETNVKTTRHCPCISSISILAKRSIYNYKLQG